MLKKLFHFYKTYGLLILLDRVIFQLESYFHFELSRFNKQSRTSSSAGLHKNGSNSKDLHDQTHRIISSLLDNLGLDASTAPEIIKDLPNVLDNYHHGKFLDDLFAIDKTISSFQQKPDTSLVITSKLAQPRTAPQRRNILFITGLFPSLYHGGGNHVRYFIQILSKNNNVYLATSYTPNDLRDEVIGAVSPYCKSILKIPEWRFPNSRNRIKKWLNGLHIDVVHYEWPRSLSNFDKSLGDLHIFTYMESTSLRALMELQSTSAESPAWLDKFAEFVHNLREEIADTVDFDGRIAVTSKDGEFFRRMLPGQEFAVLNHGVTFDDYTLPEIDPEPDTLVFSGSYAHAPNTEAVEYFFDKIWKKIKHHVPAVRIYLVGADPSNKLAKFAGEKDVIITGAVPDIREYIQKATICIAPLISGAGIRVKVIEYAALRRTFVGTGIATEDLVFRPGVDYLLADDPDDFAQSVVKLLKDHHLVRELSLSLYETARNNYDNNNLVDYQTRFYEYLERKRTNDRQ